jgi:hypothetical protein
VEVEGKPAPLVLLRRDELFGETRALALPLLRLDDEARVLRRPGREVGEHAGAHEVPAVEAAGADEAEGPDLVPAHGERNDHSVLRQPRFSGRVLGRGEEAGFACVEEPLGLLAHALDDLLRLQRAGDHGDRVHERFEKARLRLQRVLGRLVPPSLGNDQVDGESPGERGRRHEPRRREPEEAGGPANQAADGCQDRGGS